MLSGVKRKIRVPAPELFAQVSGDQFAVETAIFNEDFIGLGAGYDDPRNVDSWYVRFQSLWIAHRPQLFGRQFDADAAQEVVVGMVSGKRKHKIVFQTDRARRRRH